MMTVIILNLVILVVLVIQVVMVILTVMLILVSLVILLNLAILVNVVLLVNLALLLILTNLLICLTGKNPNSKFVEGEMKSSIPFQMMWFRKSIVCEFDIYAVDIWQLLFRISFWSRNLCPS